MICSHGLFFTPAFATLGSALLSTPTPNASSVSFSPYDLSSEAGPCQRTFAWRCHRGVSYPAAGTFSPCATCGNLYPCTSPDLLWPWSTWTDGCHRGLRCRRINYWPWHLVDAFWRPLRVCTRRTAASGTCTTKYVLLCAEL